MLGVFYILFFCFLITVSWWIWESKIGMILEFTGGIAAPGCLVDAHTLKSKKINNTESTILTGQDHFGLDPRKELAQ